MAAANWLAGLAGFKASSCDWGAVQHAVRPAAVPGQVGWLFVTMRPNKGPGHHQKKNPRGANPAVIPLAMLIHGVNPLREPEASDPFPLPTLEKKKCYTVIKQLRCKRTAGTKGCSRHDKGTVANPHFKKAGKKRTHSTTPLTGRTVRCQGTAHQHVGV
jgi:hypothetical protein